MLSTGTLEIPTIAPHKHGKIKLPSGISVAKSGETWLSVTFHLKHATPWAESRYEIAWLQHRLDSAAATLPMTAPAPKSPLTVHSTKATHTVSGSEFELVFSRATGSLTRWCAGGRSLLDSSVSARSPLGVGFWRPPTDNDVPHDLIEWRRYGLDAMQSQLRKMDVVRGDDQSIQITTETYLSPPILAWGFTTTMKYTMSSDGSLKVSTHLKPDGPIPKSMPRMGLDLRLADEIDNAAWFGLGPGEAYADKKRAQKVGIYKATTSELHTPYEVPQEGGNRMETRWLKMRGGRGWGLRVTRESEPSDNDDSHLFQWVATRYSAEAVEAAKHACDLVPENLVYLRLDIESSGVGTGACGPRILEKYQVKCEERKFTFRIEPYLEDDL